MNVTFTVTRTSGRRFTVSATIGQNTDGTYYVGAHSVAQNDMRRDFPHAAEYAYSGTNRIVATKEQADEVFAAEVQVAMDAALNDTTGYRASCAALVEDDAAWMAAEDAAHDVEDGYAAAAGRVESALWAEGLFGQIVKDAADAAYRTAVRADRHADEYEEYDDGVAAAEAANELAMMVEREYAAEAGGRYDFDEPAF